MAELSTAPDSTEAARLEDMARQWLDRTRVLNRAHERSATIYSRRGVILSVAILTLASVVGTSIFATIDSEPSTTWKVSSC